MSFEFAFEKLLKHKRQLEDMARREWIEAQSKVDLAVKELDRLYDQVDDSRKRVAELETGGGTHGAMLTQIDEFIGGQKIRIHNQRMKIRELAGEAERLQEAMVEAAKERKTLEKLREKRLAEYKVKLKKREMKELDELVVTRFKTGSEG